MNAASPPLSQRTSCAAAGPQMGVVDWAQEARRAAVNAIDDALLQPLYRLHDKKVVHHTTKTLLAVEKYLLRFVEDPYMPEILKRVIRKAWELTCDEMNAELVEEVLDMFGQADRQLAKYRLDGWPGPPRLWYFGDAGVSTCEATRRFWLGMRAKFLYAQIPADASTWKVVRDPLGFVILALKMQPISSLFAFFATFVLIERDDEYQLVRFILKVKAASFFSQGIVPAVALGMGYHRCLLSSGAGCVDSSPASSPTFPLYIASTVGQLCLIWWCFGLLACKQAYGGKENIQALEYVRLDVADGKMDGAVTEAHIRKLSKVRGAEAAAPSCAIHVHQVRDAIEAQRRRRQASRRMGGYLPYFMLFDLFVLIALVLGWIVGFVYNYGLDPQDPIFWSSLYDLKMLYGLGSFPFLLFQIYPIGEALHEAQATGYDQSGQLVRCLYTSDRLAIYRATHPPTTSARVESILKRGPSPEEQAAATKIQAVRRGRKVRTLYGFLKGLAARVSQLWPKSSKSK